MTDQQGTFGDVCDDWAAWADEHETFVDAVRDALWGLCSKNRTFVTYDVWQAVPERLWPPLDQRRVMGPLMNAARGAGWCRFAGYDVGHQYPTGNPGLGRRYQALAYGRPELDPATGLNGWSEANQDDADDDG